MNKGKYNVLPLFTLGIMLLTGCSTIVNAHRQKQDLMHNYIAGARDQALEELEYKLRPSTALNSSRADTGDEVMWRLEAGSLNLVEGHDDRSIRHFSRAEELIENFDERALLNLREAGAETSVLLTNPNALPYRGWCRDRIMIPVYKAFAYLGKKDEQGFQVELYRIRSNQDKVMDSYRKYFEAEDEAMTREKAKNRNAAASVNPNTVLQDSRNRGLNDLLNQTTAAAHRGYADFLNPFAIFLSGYGYIRSGDYQNAAVDFERLYKALPGNPLARQYYAFCLRKLGRNVPAELQNIPVPDYSPERGHVLVVFANGRSAALRQVSLYIPIFFPGYATLAAVAWPVCRFYPLPFRTLQVNAGSRVFQTVTIADMNGIMAAEYNRRLPGMIVRICLSTAVKEFGSYVATRAAASGNQWAGLATAVGTSAYKAMFNTADTRTWEILPQEFQIIQFAMPKDRKIRLGLPSGHPADIQIPEHAGSAVVLVHAPSPYPAAFTCRVFPLKH